MELVIAEAKTLLQHFSNVVMVHVFREFNFVTPKVA